MSSMLLMATAAFACFVHTGEDKGIESPTLVFERIGSLPFYPSLIKD